MATRNLTLGSKGQDVKDLQKSLGITADGIFGEQTLGAVTKYQRNNNLPVTGVINPSIFNTNPVTTNPVVSPETPQGFYDPKTGMLTSTGTAAGLPPMKDGLPIDLANIRETQLVPPPDPNLKTGNIGGINYSYSTSSSQIGSPMSKEALEIEIAQTKAKRDAIENDLNNISSEKEAYLTAGGTYDKLKQLSDLKSTLNTLENQKNAIPIQAKQDLRGRQGTIADYQNYTTPQLENNALANLSANSAATTLQNQIQTELSIAEQKFADRKEKDQMMYKTQNDYLNTLQTAYSSIISDEQKVALENAKNTNSTLADLAKDDADKQKALADIYIKRGDFDTATKITAAKDYTTALGFVDDATLQNEVAKKDTASDLVSQIDNILNSKGLSVAVGGTFLDKGAFQRIVKPNSSGTIADAKAFRAALANFASTNTLKTFANVKAQGVTFGALSEKELDLLSSAAITFGKAIDNKGNVNISEKDFKEQMNNYKIAAQKVYIAQSMGKEAYAQSGLKESNDINLINRAYEAEKTREQLTIQQSAPTYDDIFQAPTNKTSLNIPQKNNNMGNIKAGGVADKYAVGKDKYGHLIFPDVQTGILAFATELNAKINGQSRYLPANPTLAQLGKVYAEDPNWTNSVAKILGVPPTTPTKNIPLENLMYAIAKQEGYFA